MLKDNSIAIIGMALRFPGALNAEQFWENLRKGVDSIRFFTEDELIDAGLPPDLINAHGYVKASGYLENADCFDASFFGVTPKEAELMDPQHRQFLECAWEALENAGYDAEKFPGRIGVFAGGGMSTYYYNIYRDIELMRSSNVIHGILGNDKDHLPTRVSYKLNLKGPGINIQTACSTSLVAVHYACSSLLTAECDIAISGGVTIRIGKEGYFCHEGGVTSPDGSCRAFDVNAAGTVPGNGAGVVVLKRLSDVLKDGDTVHAVIRGSAVNNDGGLKIGYTAPSIEGQADVILSALKNAGVNPETISYIEAHGTGTELGDPIEMAALIQAFRKFTSKNGFCAIGSVKTNIGHLDTAAGVAGLIKTVLALKNKMLPPSLHYEQPNSKIDFESSPFYVNTQLAKWENKDTPRRAGVSSFGMGGTNVHVVLEEASVISIQPELPKPRLLVFSAKTQSALVHLINNIKDYLNNGNRVSLGDIAYTLQIGRRDFDFRHYICVQDMNDAINQLERDSSAVPIELMAKRKNTSVVFVYPGQGSQHPQMGAELYKSSTIFCKQVDQCSEALMPYLKNDIRQLLYPTEEKIDWASQQLNQTVNSQTTLFVIEYALTKLWMEMGISPNFMIGHSLGEIVAACISGVISLNDALMLTARRGQLMQSMPTGSMLVLPMTERDVFTKLGSSLSIAAVNGPSLVIVSGPDEAIDKFQEIISMDGIEGHRLHTSHAFHSSMMEPVRKTLIDIVKGIKLKPPKIPYISNVTGTWITESQALDPNYWGDMMRQPVRFSDGVCELLKDKHAIMLEVGPGETLSTLIKRHPQVNEDRCIFNTLPHPKRRLSDVESFLNALGSLWKTGKRISWGNLYTDGHPARIPLPTYPFERNKFNFEVRKIRVNANGSPSNDLKKIIAKQLQISQHQLNIMAKQLKVLGNK